MADALKDQFGPSAPRAIAAMIRAVHPDFPQAIDVLHKVEALLNGRRVALGSFSLLR